MAYTYCVYYRVWSKRKSTKTKQNKLVQFLLNWSTITSLIDWLNFKRNLLVHSTVCVCVFICECSVCCALEILLDIHTLNYVREKEKKYTHTQQVNNDKITFLSIHKSPNLNVIHQITAQFKRSYRITTASRLVFWTKPNKSKQNLWQIALSMSFVDFCIIILF